MSTPVRSRLLRTTDRLFAIDLRSLAALRITLGVLLIWDLIARSADLRAHYTDSGVLPVAVYNELYTDWSRICFHAFSGSAWYQATLFVLAGLFALSMLVGFHTRIATFASFLMLLSLQNRNPTILQGSDQLMDAMMFWSLFLPTGARWSIDRLLSTSFNPPTRHLSVATAALLLQVCLVYWFTVVLKAHPIWLENQAVYYALNIDAFATPFGIWLREQAALLPILTWATLRTELFGPILAFCPFWTQRVRVLVVLMMAGMHVGFAMGLEVGPFPYVSIASWIVFIPTLFWDWAEARRPVNRAMAWARAGVQSALKPLPLPTVRPFNPRGSWVMSALAGLAFLYIVAWNVRGLNFESYARYFPPRWVNLPGNALGIGQYWSMFAPFPLTEDGWYVIHAKLADGSEVDLFREGRPVSWEKPAHVAPTFRNHRWRKYLMNLSRSEYRHHRPHAAIYFFKDWEHRHPTDQRIMHMDIVFMLERTLEDRIAEPRPVKLLGCRRETLLHQILTGQYEIREVNKPPDYPPGQ